MPAEDRAQRHHGVGVFDMDRDAPPVVGVVGLEDDWVADALGGPHGALGIVGDVLLGTDKTVEIDVE